jgi:hypothetical protein
VTKSDRSVSEIVQDGKSGDGEHAATGDNASELRCHGQAFAPYWILGGRDVGHSVLAVWSRQPIVQGIAVKNRPYLGNCWGFSIVK